MNNRNLHSCGSLRLADLKTNEAGIITGINGSPLFRRRLMEMGFIPDRPVRVVKNAPLMDPVEYRIMDSYVFLRRKDASSIEVAKINSGTAASSHGCSGISAYCGECRHSCRSRSSLCMDDPAIAQNISYNTCSTRVLKRRHARPKAIKVALVGNPNSGKTSLFNSASGARQKVGNFAGVTVDVATARIRHRGIDMVLVDLPGAYSLINSDAEEASVIRYLLNEDYDCIINIVDSSNLERNLYLTTQCVDMEMPMVIALNMFDELLSRGDRFDYTHLSEMTGIPIVPTVATKGEGIEELLDRVTKLVCSRHEARRQNINYGTAMERAIADIELMLYDSGIGSHDKVFSLRFLAIRLIEGDHYVEKMVSGCSPDGKKIAAAAKNAAHKIVDAADRGAEIIAADSRYGFISGALREIYMPSDRRKVSASEKIDNVITHRIWGFPFFLAVLWLMFQITFQAGDVPAGLIEIGFASLGSALGPYLGDGVLHHLIVDGIITGAGSVTVFLPNILILFFFISILEDTGYMARAAFIMDRLMHAMGLHGRSFIPMLMGFGCNVPAIMATRTIENRANRMLTMLVIPFMSCSARLPIYVLLCGAFFGAYAGSVMFGLYMLGIATAVLTGIVLKKTIYSSHEAPFVMELPPYRMPRLKNTLRQMWSRVSDYLKKIGGVILIASILIWALGHFPEKHYMSGRILSDSLTAVLPAEDIVFSSESISEKSISSRFKRHASQTAAYMNRVQIEDSYLGNMGKFIEKPLSPLGLDWHAGVALVTGVAAKEVIISTMSILYPGEGELSSRIMESGGMNSAKALAFLVFILLYVPCMATIAVIRRESGGWLLPAATVIYTTAVAWAAAFIVYRAGLLLI